MFKMPPVGIAALLLVTGAHAGERDWRKNRREPVWPETHYRSTIPLSHLFHQCIGHEPAPRVRRQGRAFCFPTAFQTGPQKPLFMGVSGVEPDAGDRVSRPQVA
jgi:hypothetical protein